MRKCRLFFSKTGKIKYTSHLDMMRIFRRAFNRAELEVKHSEGFNPHPIMSIVLPLSTGHESVCEMLDVTFGETVGSFSGIPGRINSALPDGIRVEKAQIPMRKPGEIGFVRSKLELLQKTDAVTHDVVIQKTTKSGSLREIVVSSTSFKTIDDLAMECLLPPDVNPMLAANALGIDFCRVTRLEVLDINGVKFE